MLQKTPGGYPRIKLFHTHLQELSSRNSLVAQLFDPLLFLQLHYMCAERDLEPNRHI
jgi:hypothetical protein